MKIKITKKGRAKIEKLIIQNIPMEQMDYSSSLRIALLQNMIVNMLESDKGFVEIQEEHKTFAQEWEEVRQK